ncbi:hypothetical protein JOF53_007363 [Crossiella equi]|uniref:Uncharacterized protein n=1 Tax=Crossiella equi TaxID=130796 RepID=A0ABS5APY1_9PSEU|nr:hypothetical protein [Crossiella equi]MBP2478491.1 hypothetical protein [Crossiella equi]
MSSCRTGLRCALQPEFRDGSLIAAKIREPGDDLISRLGRADLAGHEVESAELLLVAGGCETTAMLLPQAVRHLCAHPGQRAELLAVAAALVLLSCASGTPHFVAVRRSIRRPSHEREHEPDAPVIPVRRQRPAVGPGRKA